MSGARQGIVIANAEQHSEICQENRLGGYIIGIAYKNANNI